MATDEQAHAPRTAVTVDILRDLLGSDVAEANLVLEGGRVGISSGSEGLVLVSREELLERIGAEPDPTELAEQADLLNTEIRLQGA
ncbi:hypothetical protein DFR70_101220 [Nocardia tenerifensis]|uniref:Uncharacterized protein n=1 Tax=Nocardia tenerifensis TaxID=228006 RepID=A0A318KDG4_9NOCA|nr:hypothetical protein [Nocardia tenerifensis]PXX70799.1 hypothetical protein DFR70_101220 [Nocardia tenerifensis]